MMGWFSRLIDLMKKKKPPVDPVPDPTGVGGGWSIPLTVAINAERKRRGKVALTAHGPACTMAETQAVFCARAGRLDHGEFYVRALQSYPNRAAAENLAWGQNSPDHVVADWLKSPGHAKNLMGDWTIVGAGRATGKDGRDYWCSVFVR